ncbi:hypothetical protein EE612_041562, partial [Oryza sativa]
ERCPRAEEVVREEVRRLYEEHGNTAVSWLRALFHDCMVYSCDASLLLHTTTTTGVSEQSSHRSFGMRNFKYITAIKAAVERECPATVSCADILALAARDGVAMLGGPSVAMRTGRRDSRESYYGVVEQYIPNHNDSVSTVLSRFAAIGVDTEGSGGAAGRALGGARPLLQPGGEAVPAGGRQHGGGVRGVPAGEVPDGCGDGGHERGGVRAQRPRHAHAHRQHVLPQPARRAGAPPGGPAAGLRRPHGALRPPDGRRQRLLPPALRRSASHHVRERAAHRRTGEVRKDCRFVNSS